MSCAARGMLRSWLTLEVCCRMAVMDIVLYPDEPLLRKATPYESVGPEMPKLVEDMLETMHHYEGVGLAGPQVGLAKRIFVWCEGEGEPGHIINPELSGFEGREEKEEGCLSMPRLYHAVPRATRVLVRGVDCRGNEVSFEAKDFLARIMQHENDHLDGILFPDRLDIITRETLMAQWDEIRKEIMAGQAGHRAF